MHLILFSGESGAGKTESTKLIINQLIYVSKGNTQLEQQIIQVSLIKNHQIASSRKLNLVRCFRVQMTRSHVNLFIIGILTLAAEQFYSWHFNFGQFVHMTEISGY